jgi:hypothetical protein
MNFKTFLNSIFVITGFSIFALNIYGLTQDIRPTDFTEDELRFGYEPILSFEDSIHQLKPSVEETKQDYALRATELVSSSLTHVQWDKVDNETSHQLIPIWENFILYFMGKFSGIPEYERYHYANYLRSLKRGIGICGDASMVLSQLLDKQNIPNKIVSFPKHVFVIAQLNDSDWILDPDFGVYIQKSLTDFKGMNDEIESVYEFKGYSKGDILSIRDAYEDSYIKWDGVSHFITKKYYFEIISYWLKWLIPFILLFSGLFLIFKTKKRQ